MSSPQAVLTNNKPTLALCIAFAYSESDMGRSSVIRLGQARLAEIARNGIPVPTYDRARLAVYVHELASDGSDWGIVGLGLLAGDGVMAEALGGQDCLYTLIEKDGGELSAQVIGSITRYVHAPAGQDGAASELIAAPGTLILSLTVTESGYAELSAT